MKKDGIEVVKQESTHEVYITFNNSTLETETRPSGMTLTFPPEIR